MRRSATHVPSPFVVFADLAIAIAFIFAICSIAMSRILTDMTRDRSQETMQSLVRGEIRSLYPESTEAPAAWANDAYDRRRAIELRGRNGALLATVTSNGSYQRIQIGPMFAFDGDVLTAGAKETLQALARTIKDAYLRGEIGYVYFHGTEEAGEGADDERQAGRRRLDERRADAAYRVFVEEGAIARNSDDAYLAGSNRKVLVAIDPLFAIPYGKAHLYPWRQHDEKHPQRLAGRVDLVLFYTDTTDDRGGGHAAP